MQWYTAVQSQMAVSAYLTSKQIQSTAYWLYTAIYWLLHCKYRIYHTIQRQGSTTFIK